MDATLAVVIAAGLGSRLQPLTNNLPKCMLDVQGFTMLGRAIETFDELCVQRAVVIGGFKADRLHLPDNATLVMNDEYMSNNILHSLACARHQMEGEEVVLISYSDIIFRKQLVETFLEDDGFDISIVVDQDWATRYQGRTQHPLSQAEAVNFNGQRNLVHTGKNLLSEGRDPRFWGEFIGMMKMTPQGRDQFWETFDDVNSGLSLDSPFQGTPAWGRAYITDLLQELANRGVNVHCSLIRGGWLEIDTIEDYELSSTFNF